MHACQRLGNNGKEGEVGEREEGGGGGWGVFIGRDVNVSDLGWCCLKVLN